MASATASRPSAIVDALPQLPDRNAEAGWQAADAVVQLANENVRRLLGGLYQHLQKHGPAYVSKEAIEKAGCEGIDFLRLETLGLIEPDHSVKAWRLTVIGTAVQQAMEKVINVFVPGE